VLLALERSELSDADHEKGAFTGALMQKKGRFELADHGTLFLDEIGDISLDLQPKLLRALQEREFERLGSTKTIRVDVRLIAATHRDLQAMIRNNQFREDLFYRLNVWPIEIPPLRERREDIPLLVHYFVLRATPGKCKSASNPFRNRLWRRW
jgi:formate hydrogenlyase transcriptional activator